MIQRDHVIIALTHNQNAELTKLYERHFDYNCDYNKAGIIIGQPDMYTKKAVFSYLTHNEAELVRGLIRFLNWIKGFKPLHCSDPEDSRFFRL